MNDSLSILAFQAALSQTGAAVTHAAAAAPVPAHVAGSFEAMMQRGVMGPGTPSEDTSGTMISEMVRGEDLALQYVSNDMLYMINNVDSMSMGELTAASIQLQIEAASLQVDMQTKMSVVTSSKDAIETLMKNQ
ncbi:type III secretion protein HrpB2 [Paraburkholderia rhizosphaerae]|uniref:Type III secretion inner rod protein HrpB2 n=1 Tax=Paraburkholderia rhizosphaerae TaxID=480658 RepID=A0A4R8LKV6_9BURK|nr:type III secretion protein HrpB2 [Paraburkholderia rhizosphaerae]TDY45162.1 type III secretion inner rod protein HrpB2 [Paraburkholderia rhizosphaerae]